MKFNMIYYNILMTLKYSSILFFLYTFITHIHAQTNNYKLQISSKPLSTHPAYDNDWYQVGEALKLQYVNQISIINAVITLDGLEKLFKQNLSRIKILLFQKCTFNQQTVKFVLNQNRFYQFQDVIFLQCNIFNEDLADLHPRLTKIRGLALSKNRISTAGFQYLSRLKMNLTKLQLSQTSLIDDEAVDAVILFGLSELISLDLCATAISGDNLLRILKEINLQKLKFLRICTNNFPLSFYQQFSNLNFSALQHLNINDLNIDEDGFEFLMKMKFPMLNSINLIENQLTSQVGCKFFVKERFPQLKGINLDQNFINTTFLNCLKNQNFVLKHLSCVINKMNLDGPKYITNLNTSQLARLWYASRSTTPEIMKRFFLDTDFSSLQLLEIGDMRNAGDYSPYILQRKWSKLKSLNMKNVEDFDDKLWSASEPIFPELEQLRIEFEITFKQVKLVKFVRNIQKIAPKLTRLTLENQMAPDLLASIINGSLANSLTVKMKLIVNNIFPSPNQFQATFDPVQKCKIHIMYLSSLFVNYLFSKGAAVIAGKNFEEIVNSLNELLDLAAQVNGFQNHIIRNLDYSELKILYQTPEVDFISRLLKNNGNTYVFTHLEKLVLSLVEGTPLQLIKNCQFPYLKTLIITKQDSRVISNLSLSGLHNKFTYLQSFLTDAVINKDQFKSFFKYNNLTYLTQLNFQTVRNLRIQDISEIHSYIPYLSRIKRLAYNQAFINHDLSFISKAGIQPETLQFYNILFNPGVLKQLCDLNYEFMLQLTIYKAGVDDKSIGQLLDCIQNKKYYNKKRNINFPKMKVISFESNYIGSEGTQKIMRMGMPLVETVQLDFNIDSEIFNTVFRSPWSKRIKNFIIKQQKSGSIDPNLDPKNTRKLQKFSMLEASLQDQDILTLSHLQFFQLETLHLGVRRIENCVFLQSLLKLTKNTMEIHIKVDESPKLNSTCLKHVHEDMPWIEPEALEFIGNFYYGQVANFGIHLLGKTSEWKSLRMKNSPIPDQDISDIFDKADFSELISIFFEACEITDNFLRRLSQKSIENVKQINLKNNPSITSEGLKHLLIHDYNSLINLLLSKTNIGDQGIEYLVQKKFENLDYLELNNVGLTKQGILLLNQLQAPALTRLDISNNGLTFDQILLLNPQKWNLKRLIIYPSLEQKQIRILNQQFDVEIKTHLIKDSLLDVDQVQFYDVPLEDEENRETVQ